MKLFDALLACALSVATLGPLAPMASAQEGKLVLYTSQPNTDAQQTIDAFKAKFPKVDVTFVRDGTPRVMAKLRAEFEAGAPQADVLLIADAVTMASLKAEGRLLAHDKADVGAYAAGLFDADRTWFSTKLITTGIVYNTKAPFKPTSWADLVKPEAKGLVIMPSPLASGAALIHAASLTGTLDGGWAYYEKLKANGAVAAQGNGDVLKQVAGSEKLFGMIVDFMPIREKAKGAPLEFVFPTDGVSAIGEPVAILKATKNPDAAKAFVDFLLSKEGQELAAKQGYIPAHPAVALPAGYPDRGAIKILPLDAAKALADDAANKKKFVDIFGQ
jgi:iron(III) transport system substrate-binding protein